MAKYVCIMNNAITIASPLFHYLQAHYSITSSLFHYELIIPLRVHYSIKSSLFYYELIIPLRVHYSFTSSLFHYELIIPLRVYYSITSSLFHYKPRGILKDTLDSFKILQWVLMYINIPKQIACKWWNCLKNRVSWIWRELFRLACKWKTRYANPRRLGVLRFSTTLLKYPSFESFFMFLGQNKYKITVHWSVCTKKITLKVRKNLFLLQKIYNQL